MKPYSSKKGYSLLLKDKIQEILKGLEPEWTTYKIALNYGIDHANLSKALKGTTPFSDSMLQKLGEVPEIGVSYERLRLWKTMDENPEVRAVVASIGEDEFLKIAAQKQGKQNAG